MSWFTRQVQSRARSVILMLVAVSAGACETSVDIDLPTHDPLIMINSFFWPDARFELYLGEAVDVPTGTNNISCISDGTVELWAGDQRLEILPHVGECLYRTASRRPQSGVTYTIKASAAGYRDVEATDTVPQPVPTSFEYKKSPGNSFLGRYDVTITLADPAEVDNWYRLMAFYRHEDEAGIIWYNVPGFKTDDEAIVVENQGFIDPGDDESYLETAFFSDERVTAGDYTIEIEVPGPYADGSVHVDLIVVLDGISKHFFDYGTTYRLQRDVGDNPFAEPVQVTTNVTNGFGIFGGFDRQELNVRIK